MLTREQEKELNKQDPYWFEEFFFRDLDGWFSSNIACCDKCYDDFLEKWPSAFAADEAEFQCNSISLDCFYSGSRLQDAYTEEQFYKFLPLVPCPRCGNTLEGNMWPYELPFDVVDGFEHKIKEIAEIFQNTPFLLLDHPFAKEVYEAITELSKETEPKTLDSVLHRARTKESLKNKDESQFDFPPSATVTEGRYNHAGIPVLYLASDPETCFHELRKVPCLIAKIQITDPIKVLDLSDTYDSHENHTDLLNTLVYSSLLSARQDSHGWWKPKYIFSRFVSDCAKSAGFNAIKYPSTRTENDNYNIVILDKKFSLNKSSKLVDLFPFEDDQEPGHPKIL